MQPLTVWRERKGTRINCKSQNLYRHSKSGRYYAFFKRGGKQIRRSLKTNDQELAHVPHPTPPATPARGLMLPPSSETCIKIAKALKELNLE